MQTFLYPPTIDWFYLYQRPQQLFSAFAKMGCRAVFCNNAHFIPQPAGVRKLEHNLFLVNRADPYTIPMEEPPLLWLTYPPHYEIIDQYPHSAVIFDAVDEPTEEFSHWKEAAAQVIAASDLVFASSQKIIDYYSSYGKPIHLIPNGADFPHFAKLAAPVEPYDIKRIPHPRICYSGALARWIDWELVEEVANHRPDYSFVMVGPALGKQKFPRAPNLYYLGLKPYKLVPSYLHYSDVLIIPFRVSSMTQACNPIKLWEYLATGKPIVSTNLPEVSNIKEVNIAQTPDEFSSSLEAALRSGNNRLAKTKRIEVARQNDWSQRAHEILAIINQNR